MTHVRSALFLTAFSLSLSIAGGGCGTDVSVGARDGAIPIDARREYVRTDECGNGLDDDGNGRIDDGCPCGPGETQSCFDGPHAARGVGFCADGRQTCRVSGAEWGDWGSAACEGARGASDEQCDGLDHDCDGAIDEGCPCAAGETRACALEFSRAPCRSGSQTCASDGTWGGCVGAIGPMPDVCDGIDNDCDGSPDVGCGCVPVPEICRDRLDNDCDGAVDEPVCDPDWGMDAGTGTDACIASIEACGDRLDNDCDGLVDEGCADGCEGITCSGRGACFNTTAGAACDCDRGFHAVGLTCVADDPADPCRGVTCATGTCMAMSGVPTCLCVEPWRCLAREDYGTGACVSRWDSCSEIDCSGHGTCVASPDAPERGAQCTCDAGYRAIGRFQCESDAAWLPGADCAAAPARIADSTSVAAPHTEPQALFAHGDSLYLVLPHGMGGSGCDVNTEIPSGNIVRIPKRGGPAEIVDRAPAHEYASGLGFLEYAAINRIGDRLAWVRVPASVDVSSVRAEVRVLSLPASSSTPSEVLATFPAAYRSGSSSGLIQPTGRVSEASDGSLFFVGAYPGHPMPSEQAHVYRVSAGVVSSLWNASAFMARGLGMDGDRFFLSAGGGGVGSALYAVPRIGGPAMMWPTPRVRGFDVFEWVGGGWAYINVVGTSGVELYRVNTTDGRGETVVAADISGAIDCGAGEICYGELSPPALHAVIPGGATRTIVSGRTLPPRWLAADERCVYWLEAPPSDPDPNTWELWSVAIR